MIVRIVKMQFREDEVQNFKKVFDASKEKIRAFPGILHLELLQDRKDQCTLFTYSQWESEEDLEKYRKRFPFQADADDFSIL